MPEKNVWPVGQKSNLKESFLVLDRLNVGRNGRTKKKKKTKKEEEEEEAVRERASLLVQQHMFVSDSSR